jgi:acetoacetate decarboxylase
VDQGLAGRRHGEGKLTLRDSPWDPIVALLPQESEATARLWTPASFDRDISLAGKIDADAYAPYADTISGSRWPGENGGPKRS